MQNKLLYNEEIVTIYDSFYLDYLSIYENGYIASLIVNKLNKKVVDLGCGTGLLLEMCRSSILPEKYLGLDISEPMIKKAISKFYLSSYGTYKFEVRDCSHIEIDKEAFYVSLFASPSYFEEKLFEKLVKGGAEYFLMFGLEGYSSRVLKENGKKFEALYNLPCFNSSRKTLFSNYMIVQNF